MTDLTPNHPAVEALARELAQLDAGDPWPSNDDLGGHHILGTRDDEYRFAMLEEARAVLNTVLPRLTADDLRNTPAGRDLIREGIVAARNLEWMQPLMTPGGHIFNPAIPGDEMRAVREDALAREAMQNMRESEQGRALMAEAWKKFQEHYAAEWEEAYPEDIFPSPAPPPATVSRESVAAAMMRQWAKNLRADPNPYLEGDA